jgi:hypothetical protein
MYVVGVCVGAANVHPPAFIYVYNFFFESANKPSSFPSLNQCIFLFTFLSVLND